MAFAEEVSEQRKPKLRWSFMIKDLLCFISILYSRLEYQEVSGVASSHPLLLPAIELTSRTLYNDGRIKYGGWMSPHSNDIPKTYGIFFTQKRIWVIRWSVVFQKALVWYFPVINRAQARLLLVSSQWLLCHLSVWTSFGFRSNLTTIPNSLWDTKFAKDGVDGRKS